MDLGVIGYYGYTVYGLQHYYSHRDKLTGKWLDELNTEVSYFIGTIMLIAAVGILLSYLYMHKVFVESTLLQGSQYKTNLQRGFLIIAVAYAFRAAYSLSFKYYKFLDSRFWKLFL